MKLHFLSISFLSLASAFSTSRCPSSSRRTTVVDSNIILSAEETASDPTTERKKPLSPKEIMEQQREKQGLPDPDDHPKLYSDEILDDMKEILFTLEKRVQEGPGSINTAEVEKFVSISKNVLDEMKQKEYERLENAASPSAGTATTASESSTTTASATATAAAVVEKAPADDYDPSGGQGSLPKGTVNTYIIPGMEQMSPVEYRKALQQSISARQDKRRTSGTYGNRNTWDYLNNLSGDNGVLKKDEKK